MSAEHTGGIPVDFSVEQINTSSSVPLIERTRPHRNYEGILVVQSAPEVPYHFAETMWDNTNNLIDASIDRGNFQVVLVNTHSGDTVSELGNLLHNESVPLGPYNPSYIFEDVFPDGDKDLRIVGESPKAEHAYLVASILDEEDFSRVRRVADHYKNTLNAEFVTLVATYMSGTRQDKNIKTNGEYASKTLNIRAEMGGLAPFIDRYIAIEPHSAATQAFAAQFGRPLAPISPWKPMMESIIQSGVYVPSIDGVITPDPSNSVIVGPDSGRNRAAVRIANHFGYPYVSLYKTRISPYEVEVFELDEQDKETIEGRIALSYDDEISTSKTVRTIADTLQVYNATAFAIAGVHGKFTGDWVRNLNHSLLSAVHISDSRASIGKIDGRYNGPPIIKYSLATHARDLITADVKGINFWTDEEYSQMILQNKD